MTRAIAITALLACGHPNTPAPAASLVVTRQVDQIGLRAREPMIVEHPDGTLFVAGFGEPAPTLWRSRDAGATWTRVDVGTEADGAIGNSDVDLAVAHDGTLYFTTLVFDRTALAGIAVSVGTSTDAGASWHWTALAHRPRCDRPWVGVAPDGTAHVIWNDGDGVSYAVTTDRGATWRERAKLSEHGGSSHLAVGPAGEVAARITPLSAAGNVIDRGVDLIAISSDGGATWQRHSAPGTREWSFPLEDDTSDAVMPRWVEPVAWDASGALYSLWGNVWGLWLARSRDRGDSWTTWQVGSDGAYFPYLVARDTGELAATWYSGHGNDIRAHVARIAIHGDGAPRVTQLPAWQLDVYRGSAPIRSTAGEYFGAAILRDHAIAVVTALHVPAAKRFGFTYRRIE